MTKGRKKNVTEVSNKRDKYIGRDHSIPFQDIGQDNWGFGMGVAAEESREGCANSK